MGPVTSAVFAPVRTSDVVGASASTASARDSIFPRLPVSCRISSCKPPELRTIMTNSSIPNGAERASRMRRFARSFAFAIAVASTTSLGVLGGAPAAQAQSADSSRVPAPLDGPNRPLRDTLLDHLAGTWRVTRLRGTQTLVAPCCLAQAEKMPPVRRFKGHRFPRLVKRLRRFPCAHQREAERCMSLRQRPIQRRAAGSVRSAGRGGTCRRSSWLSTRMRKSR